MSVADELERLAAHEAEADETFGEDSRPVRSIIGCALAFLEQRAGLAAVRAYLDKQLAAVRRLDPLTDSPPPAGPPDPS